jgi:subtilisin family serine protease
MARFIVSHRLAGTQSQDERDASLSALNEAGKKIRAFANVLAQRQPIEQGRGVIFLEGDSRDVEAKRAEMPPEVIVEPEVPRTTARYFPMVSAGFFPMGAETGAAGIGATLELNIISASGAPTPALVNVVIAGAVAGGSTVLSAATDANGRASVTYDPSASYPVAALIMPKAGFWSGLQSYPQNGMTIQLPELPRNGPLGWWHRLLGMTGYADRRGLGIRVGIVDTGVGPHPYLQHVQSAGAFINGGADTSPHAAQDVSDHGTHVTGIIAAKPASASKDFGGIAAGADVYVARVYAGGGPAGQEGSASNGDIAAAIDALASTQQVDVMNLSLGGPDPSEIEADAIKAAIEAGVLVICAAGNGNGAPVVYPAGSPGAVAVSAVGFPGTFPPGSIDALSVPQQADHFAASGIYAASFNNIGPQVACVGPGVGIISTVPQTGPGVAAYAAMSGTSMACPAVCASLAAILSQDQAYRKMPRNAARAQYAWSVLARSLRQLGLSSQYQGFGLMSTLP